MNMPIIRIEVENMKHSLLTVLQDRHEDLVKAMNVGIDTFITELPVMLAKQAKTMSEEIIEEAMRKAMVEFWESGKGRQTLDAMIERKFA